MMIRKSGHSIWLFVLFTLWAAACSREPSTSVNPGEHFRFETSDTLKSIAGRDLIVPLSVSSLQSGADEKFLLQGAASSQFLMLQETGKGVGISGQDLRHAGCYVLYLIRDGGIADQRIIEIMPGTPTGLIDTELSPKSIPVEARFSPQVHAVVRDSFLNPVGRELMMTWSSSIPGGDIQTVEAASSGLVRPFSLPHPDRSGRLVVAARTGEASSKEEVLDIQAGRPASIRIAAHELTPLADPGQFFTIRTDPVMDPFGNLVADGTCLSCQVEDSSGLVAQYRMLIAGGIGYSAVRNPRQPAVWSLTCSHASGTRSNPVVLEFEKWIQSFEVVYLSKQKVIDIGPLRGILNQSVRDGTMVNIMISGNAEVITDLGFTIDGKCRYTLPARLGSGDYEIRVSAGGEERSLKMYLP